MLFLQRENFHISHVKIIINPLNKHFMKKLYFIIIFSALLWGAHAQTTGYWSLSGNAGTTGSNFLGTTGAQPLIFKTNGEERMRLLPYSSFLGIGTSTPQAPLHLHVEAPGGAKSYPLLSITSSDFPLGLLKIMTTSDGNISLGCEGNLAISGGYCGMSFNRTGEIIFSSTLNPNLGLRFDIPGQVKFSISGYKNDGFLFDGFLDVSSGFRAQSAYITGTATVNALNAQTADIDRTLTTKGLNAESANISGTLTTNNLSITGNLGLGTDNPQQKLHVENGNLLLKRTIPSVLGFPKGALIFDGANGSSNPLTGAWGIQYVNSDQEGYGLNFWNYKSDIGMPHKDYDFSSILFLSDTREGNVGIGNTNPQAKLDVTGSFRAWYAEITRMLNAQNATIDKTLTTKDLKAESATITTLTATTLNIPSLNLDNITVKTATVTENSNLNGNVTVGTTTQPAQLDVNGAVTAKSANITGALSAQSATLTGALNAQSATLAGTLNSQTANVNGKIKAKEVEVTLAGWPDFVFSKEYKLPALSEVEQFIIDNNHLPNVPSAAEVENNGVNLGEMNAILIQKVEELTLYILDLQKQINELKKQ